MSVNKLRGVEAGGGGAWSWEGREGTAGEKLTFSCLAALSPAFLLGNLGGRLV